MKHVKDPTTEAKSLLQRDDVKTAFNAISPGSSIYIQQGNVGLEVKKRYSDRGFNQEDRRIELGIYTLDEFQSGALDLAEEYAAIYVTPRDRSTFYPGRDFSPMEMQAKGFKLIPVVEYEHSSYALRFGNTKSEGNHWDESISFFLLPPNTELKEITQETLECFEDWLNNSALEVRLFDQTGSHLATGNPVYSSAEQTLLDRLDDDYEVGDLAIFEKLGAQAKIVSQEEFEAAFGAVEVKTIRSRSLSM